MKFNSALLTALAALGSVSAAAIDKRAPDVNLQAAQITLGTSNGYRFPLARNVISFSVDTPGYYWFFIRAGSGGVGGNKTGFNTPGFNTIGGGGAVVQGAYVLLPNERYLAVVGQKGGDGVGTTLPKVTIPEVSAGGGGGGSFVYHSDNTLLLAAGGGGGNNFDNFLQGRDGIQNDALIGKMLGGKAVAGAGAGGAGYGTADETGFTGNGTDAGVISAKGGKTKASSAPWAGGAVDSRQAGAQGNGGYGGGGGGGKYSGGGGGGYSGGDGGRIPGNLGRPTEAGFGGTTFRRTAPYNGFDSKEAMYTGQTNIGDGEIAVFFRTDLGYPPTAV